MQKSNYEIAINIIEIQHDYGDYECAFE